MLNDVRMLLEDSASITLLKAKQVRAKLMSIMLGALVVVLVMWIINSFGYKEVNITFFFLGGIYILLQATKPLTLGVAAGAGAVAARLQDKDMSQGVIIGLKTLYLVVIGALFGFWFMGGLLATWSFAQQPIAFFYVMMGILVITVTTQLYGIKSNKLEAKLVIAYAVVIILVSFWQTIDKKDLPKVAIPSIEAIGTSKSAQDVYVEVDLRHAKHGEGKLVPMGVGTIASIRMATTMASDGYGNYACPEAKALKKIGAVITYQVSSGDKTSQVHVELSKDSKQLLADTNIVTVDTTFTLVKGPIFGATPCEYVMKK